MTKYFLLLFILLPCLSYSQTYKDIESAIEKINIQLVKGYVIKNGKSFPEEINDRKSLYNFIKRTYTSETNEVHQTFLSIEHSIEKYEAGQKPTEFIKSIIDKYVSYEYDEEVLEEIIAKIPVGNVTTIKKKIDVDIPTNNDQIYEESSNNIATSLEDKKQEINNRGAKSIKKLADEKHEKSNKTKTISWLKWVFLFVGVFIGLSAPKIFRCMNKFLNNIRSKPNSNQENLNSTKNSNIMDDSPKAVITKSIKGKSYQNKKLNWIIAHTSEVGRSHLVTKPPIPCQDNHAVKKLESGWGIAISCDGAGSAKLSHEGSEYISKEGIKLFEAIIAKNDWIKKSVFPSDDEWEELSLKALKKMRYDLEQLSKFKKVDVRDLACTVIVVIFSPLGILTTHIGDGRAGYRDLSNTWKPLISPHKGDEANQTIFITSNPWLAEGFEMSGVKVPESNVFREEITAFTVLSDGCESHSFQLGYFDKEQQKYIEENKPYPAFFEPLTKTLVGMNKEGLSQDQINNKWKNFVKQGTEKLKNESDDKTLILAVIVE